MLVTHPYHMVHLRRSGTMYAGSVRLFLPDNTGKISEARMGRDPGYLTEMMMMINLDKVGTYQLPGLFPLKKPPYPL